jgi:hypothetical protein
MGSAEAGSGLQLRLFVYLVVSAVDPSQDGGGDAANARARLAMVAAMGSELRLSKASAAASNRPSR